MERVTINLGSILSAAFIFYFVIKSAVKNGINESFLFTQKQRNEHECRELEEACKSIGEEVPEYIKEYYEKKKN